MRTVQDEEELGFLVEYYSSSWILPMATLATYIGWFGEVVVVAVPLNWGEPGESSRGRCCALNLPSIFFLLFVCQASRKLGSKCKSEPAKHLATNQLYNQHPNVELKQAKGSELITWIETRVSEPGAI